MNTGKINLFESHAWYVPEDLVKEYASLVTNPLLYVPLMIYVFKKSQRNKSSETGYKVNSFHFGPFKGWQIALITVALTYSYFMVADRTNYLYLQLTMLVPGLQSFYDLVEEALEGAVTQKAWISFITAAIYAPLFEEWLCRGVLLRGLLAKMNPVCAIVISALFFSFLHMNPWQGLNAFILGLLMGYVYYKTGCLWLTILLHFVNNGTVIVLAQFPSLMEAEWIMDMMPLTTYVVLYVLAVVVLVVSLLAFRRIPLKQKRGNIDTV